MRREQQALRASQGPLAKPVQRAIQALWACQVTRETQEPRGSQGLRETRDSRVLQEPSELLALPVHRERQDRRVSRDL